MKCNCNTLNNEALQKLYGEILAELESRGIGKNANTELCKTCIYKIGKQYQFVCEYCKHFYGSFYEKREKK